MTRLVLITLMASLAAAQNCPEQEFMRIDPNEVDPNRIHVDPASQLPLLRSVVHCRVGQTVTFIVSACDPDGDPMTVYAETPQTQAYQLQPDPNDGKYHVSYSPSSAGAHYLVVGVTDGELVREGSYVVIARENRAPVLANESFEVSKWGPVDAVRSAQRRLMAAYKWTGSMLRGRLLERWR